MSNKIDNWYPLTPEDWKLVNGEHWLAYGKKFDDPGQPALHKALSIKRAAKRIVSNIPVETLHDLLGFVMESVPGIEVISAWTDDERHEAENWAAREHIIANDHKLKRLPMPECLKTFVSSIKNNPQKIVRYRRRV